MHIIQSIQNFIAADKIQDNVFKLIKPEVLFNIIVPTFPVKF